MTASSLRAAVVAQGNINEFSGARIRTQAPATIISYFQFEGRERRGSVSV